MVEVGLRPKTDLTGKRTLAITDGNSPLRGMTTGRWPRVTVNIQDICDLTATMKKDPFSSLKAERPLKWDPYTLVVATRRAQVVWPTRIGFDEAVATLPYTIVGLQVKAKKQPLLSPTGHYAGSLFGCAGKAHVRDFVHLTLQTQLPKPKN